MQPYFLFFFLNDTAPTEIYTLPLHDALPIYMRRRHQPEEHGEGEEHHHHRHDLEDDVVLEEDPQIAVLFQHAGAGERHADRSEEHTSELQSPCNLVCRLLLEKKTKKNNHKLK